MKRIVLSLCDRTGNWSRPFLDRGYEVQTVDIERGDDVRLLRYRAGVIEGILAAPPCTLFSKAGAWTWNRRPDSDLTHALSVVDACLRAVAIYRPRFWALENPAGRLKNWLGPAAYSFQPWWFGDDYTKRTYLWGLFVRPKPMFHSMPAGCKVNWVEKHTAGNDGDPSGIRSATPFGFARAFCEANA